MAGPQPAPRASAGELVRLGDGTAVWLRDVHLDAAAAPGEVAGGAGIAAADDEGRTVGSVRYRRVYGPRAELALEIDDAFWHRGLPELLLARLCARVAGEGISTFLAHVRACDLRLLALLREQFTARESRDGAWVDVEFAAYVPGVRPAVS